MTVSSKVELGKNLVFKLQWLLAALFLAEAVGTGLWFLGAVAGVTLDCLPYKPSLRPVYTTTMDSSKSAQEEVLCKWELQYK